MSNFFNYKNEGTQVTGEKVYISGLSEVKLKHDNFFQLALYYDEGLTSLVEAGLYTNDEYDADYAGYNRIELDSALYGSYTVLYATYKSKGDYVDADDMNNKLGAVRKYECGETIAAYRAVELKNEELWYPNLLLEEETYKTIGIAIESGSVQQTIKVQTNGVLTNQSWSWDVNLPIYINANGVLAQSKPSEGISYKIAIPTSPISIKMFHRVDTTDPTNINQDETHRFVTDTEKSTWDGKMEPLGYTPEDEANKVSGFQATPDDTHFPTEKLVKDNLDSKSDTTHNHIASDVTGLTASDISDFDTEVSNNSTVVDKADKQVSATEDNFASFDGTGNIQDSGIAATNIPSTVEELDVNTTDKTDGRILKWDNVNNEWVFVDTSSEINSHLSAGTGTDYSDGIISSKIAVYDDDTSAKTFIEKSESTRILLTDETVGAVGDPAPVWTSPGDIIFTKSFEDSGGSSDVSSISDLDVNSSNIGDGKVLEWDEANSEWIYVDYDSRYYTQTESDSKLQPRPTVKVDGVEVTNQVTINIVEEGSVNEPDVGSSEGLNGDVYLVYKTTT